MIVTVRSWLTPVTNSPPTMPDLQPGRAWVSCCSNTKKWLIVSVGSMESNSMCHGISYLILNRSPLPVLCHITTYRPFLFQSVWEHQDGADEWNVQDGDEQQGLQFPEVKSRESADRFVNIILTVMQQMCGNPQHCWLLLLYLTQLDDFYIWYFNWISLHWHNINVTPFM